MLLLGYNARHGDADYPNAHVGEVYLSDAARKQGTYVVGTTGTGKSTLLLNMIYQDMRKRGPMGYEGLCVLDPHGDFTEDIMALVPEDRVDDVILFDPTNEECPLGLNLFDCDRDNARERDLVVSTIIDTLYRLFEYSWGPRMEDLLRHSILSLLLHPEPTTLIHLMLLLTNREHRYRLTQRAKKLDPVLRAYWVDQFPEDEMTKSGKYRKPREQTELVGSSLNKIGRFIVNPIIRHIVGQPHSSFDLREIMDDGKILLVNLSKGDLGADNARLLGAVIVNQILIAALSRRGIPLRQRRPFHLYVDEYQNFATKTFPDLQSEARKYAIDTVVAHQYRDQLDDENKGSTLNVANLISLRVSGRDALDLAGQFENTPEELDPQFRPVYKPLNQEEDLFFASALPSGEKLFQLEPGAQRTYSDVEMETANLLSQAHNYQAICRVLSANDHPKKLHQFRINLLNQPEVDERQAEATIARIRQNACDRAAYTREQIAAYIAEYTKSDSDDDGAIPMFDTQ